MTAGRHPSELAWVRFFAGEDGWLERRRVKRHLAGCAACRRFAASSLEERRAFEASPATREAALRLASLAPQGRAPRRWLLLALPAAALAAALLLAPNLLRDAPGLLVPKGPDLFTVEVERLGGALRPGGRCVAGDRVMARWRTSRAYLLVLERDGAGAQQVLFPPEGTASARLSGPEGRTPGSWVLDDTPGEECFVAVFSDAPLSAAAALDAPPPGASLRTVCCRKEAP